MRPSSARKRYLLELPFFWVAPEKRDTTVLTSSARRSQLSAGTSSAMAASPSTSRQCATSGEGIPRGAKGDGAVFPRDERAYRTHPRTSAAPQNGKQSCLASTVAYPRTGPATPRRSRGPPSCARCTPARAARAPSPRGGRPPAAPPGPALHHRTASSPVWRRLSRTRAQARPRPAARADLLLARAVLRLEQRERLLRVVEGLPRLRQDPGFLWSLVVSSGF